MKTGSTTCRSCKSSAQGWKFIIIQYIFPEYARSLARILTARDLRGGAALVLAAMQAEGESRVTGLTHIDRGYERFAEKLRALAQTSRDL